MKDFPAIVAEGAAMARLLYVPASQNRGEARVAVGLCVLHPALIEEIDADFKPRWQDPVSPVIYERDPLGAFLGYRPVMDWDAFWRQACQGGLRQALQKSGWQNPVLQKFGRLLLRLTECYCTTWVVDVMVDGKQPIRDETVLARFRCLRRILDADNPEPFHSQDTVERQLRETCRLLVSQKKGSAHYFPRDLFAPSFRKRKKPSTLAARLARRSGVSDERIDRTMAEIRSFEVNTELSLPPLDAAQQELGNRQGAMTRGESPARVEIPFPTGGNHDLSRAELEQIIADLSVKGVPDGLKIIKLLCFGFLDPHNVRNNIWDDQRQCLCGRVSVPNNEPTDPQLHRSRDNFLRRPIPASLCDTIKKISGTPGEELERQCNETLRKQYATSWPKLRKALTLMGPDLFGYSWILPYIGFSPEYQRPTGPQAYVHINGEILATASPYWRRLENDFQYTPLDDAYATGTNRCPRTEQIQAFFKAWKDLLAKSLAPDCSADEAVNWCNAVAAGAHMLVLLFCGLRPYRMVPLPMAMVLDPGHWRLVCQKKPFAWTLPDCVRPLLEDIHGRLVGVRRQFGLEPLGVREVHAYEFHQRQAGGLVVDEIRLGQITEALLHFPELGRFALLAPTWHRCFSNTLLRAKGVPEPVVRDFHGHYAGVANPLRLHSLNPVPITGRNVCADLIFKELGL
jgi:hypothetical protein